MAHETILPRPAAPRAARFARAARTALPLLLAALAACGDDPAGPVESDPPSSVRFVYGGSSNQGTIQGSHRAEGDPLLAVAPITQTFALGQRVASKGLIRILANVARGTEHEADWATITIPRLTVGSVDINGTCPGKECAAVSLGLDIETDVAFSQARYSCALDEGTLRITSVSDGRAKGEFSGTGSCLAGPGYQDLTQFSIASGTFDVKVIEVAS